MKRIWIVITCFAIIVVFCSIPSLDPAYAEEEVLTDDETYPRRLLIVPYPFFS